MKTVNFSLKRYRRRAFLWLRRRCDALTQAQRKGLVLGMCAVYLALSLHALSGLFTGGETKPLPVSMHDYRPVIVPADTVDGAGAVPKDHQTFKSYGQ